jgi:hypothetical protein
VHYDPPTHQNVRAHQQQNTPNHANMGASGVVLSTKTPLQLHQY